MPKAKKDPYYWTTGVQSHYLIMIIYKVFAIIFASRIKTVLPTIIDEYQSGFMCNRHISNNIRLILDILNYSELVQDDSLILLLDFYKAFDSLEQFYVIRNSKVWV